MKQNYQISLAILLLMALILPSCTSLDEPANPADFAGQPLSFSVGPPPQLCRGADRHAHLYI